MTANSVDRWPDGEQALHSGREAYAEAMTTARDAARVPALDGVRGLGLLLVLATHLRVIHAPDVELAALPKDASLIDKLLLLLTGSGWIAMDSFFVLSGYLITGILLRSKGSSRYYSSFFARRALRIFPLYYLLLLGFYLVEAIRVARPAVSPVWFVFYLQNIPMALRGELGTPTLAVTWSLAVEEHFYVIWPFVVKTLSRKRLIAVCVCAMAAAPMIRLFFVLLKNPVAAHALMPCRMDALAGGALVASLLSGPYPRAVQLLGRYGWMLGASVIVSIGLYQHGMTWRSPGTLTLALSADTLMFVSMLILMLRGGNRHILNRLFSTPLLRSLGKYSYAIYLCHFPVSYVVTAILPVFASAESVPVLWGTRWIAQAGFYVLVGVASYATGRLAWHFIEARVLRLKTNFSY